jgi:hypothetical protein
MGALGRQLSSLSYPHQHESRLFPIATPVTVSLRYVGHSFACLGAFVFFLSISDLALSYQGKVFSTRKEVVFLYNALVFLRITCHSNKSRF